MVYLEKNINELKDRKMKKNLVFLLILISYLFSINCLSCDNTPNQFQHCDTGKIIDGKYYITSGSVSVTSDQIVIKIHDYFIQVDALEIDENGVYISAKNLCPLCGYPTTIYGCTNPSCPGYLYPSYLSEILAEQVDQKP